MENLFSLLTTKEQKEQQKQAEDRQIKSPQRLQLKKDHIYKGCKQSRKKRNTYKERREGHLSN